MRGRPSLDLTGKQFGRLTVLSRSHINKHGNAVWLCLCECGGGKSVSNGNLGKTLSCGCFRKEQIAKALTTHGQRGSITYGVWQSMIRRCYDKNLVGFERWGGRGIVVCDRWLGKEGFSNFVLDMGVRPSKRHTIDRYPDNNGNYEKDNCRWATQEQQNNNRSSNVIIEYRGELKTAAEWGKELGVERHTILNRHRKGFDLATKQREILILDLQNGVFYEYIKDAAFAKNVNPSTLRSALASNNNKYSLSVV